MFHVKQIDDFLFIKSVGNVCNIATYGQEPQNGLNVKTVKFHDGKGHLPRPYAGARSTARKRQRHARRPTAGRALLRRARPAADGPAKAVFRLAKGKLSSCERQAPARQKTSFRKDGKSCAPAKAETKVRRTNKACMAKGSVRLIRPTRTISPTGQASPIIILM